MEQTTLSLRALFDQVSVLPIAERAAFLTRHCPDPAVRAQLERLLAADAEPTEGVLARAAEELAQAMGDGEKAQAVFVPGQRIGAWELLALLGEGGSSSVFRAVRDSDGVRQEVALKLLRRGLYSPDAQRQFRRERQALSQLRHPGIARLIEGGVTESGLAYIALELVDGLPITEHALLRKLTIRERVVLFVHVCRAVESAHRALIVHRDLKPSNVLVSAENQVKLLDFGIAKPLDAEDETQTQLTAFTPAYAAPEQRSGGAISTATDVYALGILLGELVTGIRMSDGSGRTPSSRIATESDPLRLPAPVPVLRRSLRGDLDNILLKAIEPDPERRYSSAAAFADDIERFLEGRPVVAHPPSRWYRARKFVQRHRTGVVMTSAFLLALLGALGAALWQTDVARREADRANTVRDFLVAVFDTAKARLPRDQRPTPEALVAQAEKQLAASTTLDSATRGELLLTLGEVSLSLASFAQAEVLLGEARRLALQRGDLGNELRALALHATALQRAGRNTEAANELGAALPAMRAVPSGTLLRALAVLAAAAMANGAPDQAIAYRREASQVAAALYGVDADETLAAELEVGNALAEAQHFPEAIAELEPGLARWRARSGSADDRYVAALGSLAAAADGMGDTAKTEQRLRELLTLKQRIYSSPHDAIAATLRELALIVGRDGGRADEAIALLDQAQAMQVQVFGSDHAEIVETHEARGNVLVAQRRVAEAQGAYREALAMCARAAIKNEVCPRARNDLGMALYREDKLDEAEAEMTQALEERRALFGNDHPTVAYSLSTLANVAAKRKDGERAVRLAAEAIAVLERSGRGASREAALIRYTHATALWRAGRNQEALPEIERVLAAWQRVAPEAKTRRAMMLVQKAQILDELGRKEDARLTAEEAIALKVPGEQLQALSRQHLRRLSGRSDVYPEVAEPPPP